MKKPDAPKALSSEARALWRKLHTEYDLTDAAGMLVLRTALEALDRMRMAQAVLDRDGVTIVDKFNQMKPHPAAAIERDARAGMLAALKALHLDLEPLQSRVGRPGGQ